MRWEDGDGASQLMRISIVEYSIPDNRMLDFSVRLTSASENTQIDTTAQQARVFVRCVTHCNTLRRAVTHCNMLQCTATYCNAGARLCQVCNALQRTATHCNALQRTATHCNALQRTATH